jgi:exodeoxyribonuclease-3
VDLSAKKTNKYDSNAADWLRAVCPDVICFQDPGCDRKALQSRLAGFGDYYVSAAHDEGRLNVAIASKMPPKSISVLAGDNPTPRFISADLGSLRVSNIYVPNGLGSTRVENAAKHKVKMHFLQALASKMHEMANDPAPNIIAGDFNIARREIDRWNGGTRRKSGCTLEEQDWFDNLLAVGWHDVATAAESSPVKWTNWPAKKYWPNQGWRLDYILANDAARLALRDFSTFNTFLCGTHAPVAATLDLSGTPIALLAPQSTLAL